MSETENTRIEKKTRGLHISKELMDSLKQGIHRIIFEEKKYLVKDYSMKQLAEDLGTNARYVSATINERYHMHYAAYVNQFRVADAKKLLAMPESKNTTIEEIGELVGFSNRQSFYTAFTAVEGTTPHKFRENKTKAPQEL